MRKVLVPLLALLASLAICATAQARTTILLLPGGSWQVADPTPMQPIADELQARGYRARAITYPVGSPIRAVRFVERVVARIPGPVILYGVSAGGSIASALASTGQVAGAVNVLGPTDLARWTTPIGLAIRATVRESPSQLRAASPYWRLGSHPSRQLVMCASEDTYVLCAQSALYAKLAQERQPDTRLRVMPGVHAFTAMNQAVATGWITNRWDP